MVKKSASVCFIDNHAEIVFKSMVIRDKSLEYYRGSSRAGSNEVTHVKLRKRASAGFQLFSSFFFV